MVDLVSPREDQQQAEGLLAQQAPLPQTPEAQIDDEESRYANIIQSRIQKEEDELRSSLFSSVDSNPDQEAELDAISQRTGLPRDTVERNIARVVKEQRTRDLQEAARVSPILAKQLSDPNFARLAHDDVERLSGMEGLLTRGVDFGRALVGQGIGDPTGRAVAGIGNLYGIASRNFEAALDAILPNSVMSTLRGAIPEEVAPYIAPYDLLTGAGTGIKDISKQIAPPQERQNFATDVVAGVGQLGTQIYMHLVFGPAASTVMMSGQGADIMAEKTAEDDATQAAKDTAVIAGAGITALTERIGLDAILKRVPPAVRNRTLRFIADKAAAGGIEFAQEVAEGLLHDLARRALTNPEAEILEGALYEGSVAGVSAAIVRTALGANRFAKDRAQQDFITALGENAKGSKLRERLPEKFRQLVEKMNEQGPVKNIYIPAEQFQTYYQSQGVNPEQKANELGATNYVEAVAAGTDVVIPIDQFTAKVAPSDDLQGLFQDIKVSQGDLTAREYAEFQAEEEQNVQEIMSQAQEAAGEINTTELQDIKDAMLNNLLEVGYEQRTADAYATVYAKTISNLAERAGVAPTELHQRYDLSVSRPLPEAMTRETQGNFDLNPVLDFMRQQVNITPEADIQAEIDAELTRLEGLEMTPEIELELDALEQRMQAFAAGELTVEPQDIEQAMLDLGLTQEDLTTIQGFLDQIGVDLAEITDNAEVMQLIQQATDSPEVQQLMGESPRLFQTATVRRGEETLADYGLDPEGRYKTREVAAALEARQREKYGSIARDDRSPEAIERIANWMSEEVEFAMLNPENSGVGWYSEKFQNALDIMGDAFPELRTDQNARDVMTALIAITSDGQKVVPNFQQAMQIYGDFREGGVNEGKFVASRGTQRQASVDNNLKVMQRLYDQMGPEAMRDYLMQERTISELKKIAKENGGEMKSDYQAHVSMPMAAVEFGPKLGAFYANLMGAHGYLTMDRWWSRTFNRYRGSLITAPTQTGLTRWKSLLGDPNMSDDEAIAATVEYRNAYADRGFKNGTELEKAANTIYKAAFEAIEDAPFNAKDRTFMLDAVNRAQEIVAEQGYNLSVADIQAILWYYEKRLYGELGARQTADISYEEAAERVAAGYAGGPRVEPVLDDGRPAPEDGADGARAIPVGEEEFTVSEQVTEPGVRLFQGQPDTDAVRGTSGRDIVVGGRPATATAIFGESTDRPVYEIADKELFRDLINEAKTELGPIGAQVTAYDDYTDARVFVFDDGASGFALDGDNIISVFSIPGQAQPGAGVRALEVAIAEGGMRLDAFDTFLPKIYERSGFRAVARLGFSREFAPEGWSYDYFSENFPATNGEPDVVFMVYDPENANRDTDNVVEEYDQGEAVQAQELAGMQQVLEQRDSLEGKRGFIQFGKDRNFNITLLDKADLSTFLHETGHFYLEVLGDLATAEGANQQLADDYATVLKFLGLESRDQLTLDGKKPGSKEYQRAVNAHEKFARANEAYLMEGKAPSADLRSLFQRFRQWLKIIYRQIESLDVTLNPQVREVFDRIYATDEEIEAAKTEMSMEPIFLDAETAGMTEQEFELYKDTVRQASESGKEALQQKLMQEMMRERKAWWKQESAKVREEVAQQIDQEPVRMAFEDLTSGEVKLNKDELVEQFGPEYIKRLPRKLQRVYTTGEGMPLEVVARDYGFPTGAKLVEALIAMPKRDEAIKVETDRIMRERHGDLLTDGSIYDEAKIALHTTQRQKVLATELRALRRKQREVRPFVQAERERAREERRQARAATEMPPMESFRAAAKGMIEQTAIRDLEPQRHLNAQRKYNKKAFTLMSQGKFAEAADAKQKEILNHFMYIEARKARERAEKIARYMAKFAKKETRQRIGKASQDYLENIDAILDSYEFKRVPLRTINRREMLLAFVAKQEAEGNPVNIPLDVLEDSRQINYRRLSSGELEAVFESVKNIENLARLKNKLTLLAEKRTLDEVAGEAIALVQSKAKDGKKKKIEEEAAGEQLKRWAKGFMLMHKKFATFFRQMDGWKDDGVMWNLFVKPVNAAADFEAKSRSEATKKLREIFKVYRGTNMQKKVYIPAMGQSVTLQTRLMVALNWGREENRQRLRDGNGLTDAEIEGIFETLTESDWEFVQNIWDYIDSYWPQISEQYTKLYGVAPQKSDNAPFRTKYGVMKGGYFPIKYDAKKSTTAQAHTVEEVSNMMKSGAYVRSQTKNGFTKEVMENLDRALLLDFGTIYTHVAEVIHDLALREYLLDTNKLLNHKVNGTTLKDTINEVYGDQTYREITDTIKDIAIGDIQNLSALEAAMAHLRSGVSIVGMGWSLMTGLMQPMGITQSFVRIGPKWVAKGMARWGMDAIGLKNSGKFIYKKSKFMETRNLTQNREINEIRNQIQRQGKFPIARETWGMINDSYFVLITQLQKVVDFPTWLGAYEKALANGADDTRAVALADQAVIDAQGGGSVKDLAGIQRGGQLQKLWTNFYSYFNTTFNLTLESFGKTKFKDPVDIGRLAVDMIMLYSIPAFLTVALKEAINVIMGGEEQDEEEIIDTLIKEHLTYMMGTMVGLREMSSVVEPEFGYSGPAGARLFAEMTKLSQQIGQGELDEGLRKRAIGTAGMILHFPAGQVNRTIEGIYALEEGEADSPAVLIFGPPRD